MFHLEVSGVVFEMLLYTQTQLVHPLPLVLQGCTVRLMTERRRLCHTAVYNVPAELSLYFYASLQPVLFLAEGCCTLYLLAFFHISRLLN